MISNYEIECGYYNLELEPIIYLIPQWDSKIIYTDGYNEAVYSGNTANVTCIKGFDINFTEESSFDERFKFTKSVSIKVNGYMNFSDLYNRFTVILKTKREEYYLVNSDFPSFVTHTYTLNANTNETELVFSSQSNIATLKLTNFEPNNVNSCKEYSTSKIKNVKLTESWASSLSTWQKSLVNKGTFSDIEPLQDSISLTEEFDGEKYTVTLGFDIPMSHFKNDWHIKLLQFTENKYRGYIQLEGGTLAFVGYNGGLFPSYFINGDIISIRMTETAIRGIAYGNDYAIIDTNIPNSIEFSGATCHSYNFESSCDWNVEEKPNYITITPSSGLADTQYELTICNTDDETGYAVSEFVIKTCNARVRPEVVIKNPIYRYTATTETVCSEATERTISSETYCSGSHNVDKYVDVTKKVSYDSGETWYIASSSSTLIEANSPDCGYRARTTSGTPYCDEGKKCVNVYNQVSYDSGANWETTATTKVVIDPYSTECNEYSNRYLTFRALEDGTFSFGKWVETHMEYNDDKLKYSLDNGTTWVTLQSGNTSGGTTPTVTSGNTILWKASGLTIGGGIGSFHSSGRFDVEGNIMSLVNEDDFVGKTTIGWYQFKSLFALCHKLVNSKNLVLPSTSLTTNCYDSMFHACSNLVTTPQLPATTLASDCYRQMFSSCSSLVTVPQNMLPATTLASRCYVEMFGHCSSLTAAPKLPATTLKRECYYFMFRSCSSLTTPANLNIIGDGSQTASGCCKQMYYDCSGLVNPPTINFAKIPTSGFMGTFMGCTSLTKSPVISATNFSKDTFRIMFSGCTSLSEITCLVKNHKCSTENDYAWHDWVKGVTNQNGIFYKTSDSYWCYGENHAPSGWTIVDYTG